MALSSANTVDIRVPSTTLPSLAMVGLEVTRSGKVMGRRCSHVTNAEGKMLGAGAARRALCASLAWSC